jgi:hypothetical protein
MKAETWDLNFEFPWGMKKYAASYHENDESAEKLISMLKNE